MKKKIATVVGARPNFVKVSPVSRIFANDPMIQEVIIHTGQHHDVNMSDVFFQELQIPEPNHALNIQGGSHGQMTGRMMEALEQVLIQENPDAVLVYGDTNTTLAGALTASKLHIPIFHVEAGLRSYNRSMPEEVNRVLTDHLSSLLFCPTKQALTNLAREGIDKGVSHTGDVMFDATLYALEKLKDNSVLQEKFSYVTSNTALLTIHRAESTDSVDTFKNMLNYVENIAEQQGSFVLFPVHPRTRKLIENSEISISNKIKIIDPLSYFETQYLLSKMQLVLTDSGGMQKEAYFHKVPCITLRSETEWVETVESGWNRLWSQDSYVARRDIEEYGDGNAAQNIYQLIKSNI